ncbi:tripartite tricarboxylate transporter TctB family protein [Salinicola halimionae]|uniref:tripartite tricarboxylate transporter TctB family protein n=1 Tax=Salinicola halimionae TaxID=1949081 RepID=UPI000DA22A90|nr:tripartite tricarboxylate transporter TctB family protein [Salinicola halimionae]
MTQDDQGTSRYSDSQDGKAIESLRLGLVSAPELPERIVNRIADQLPELLGCHIDDRHHWHVDCLTDPLIGADDSTTNVIEQVERIKRDNGWDYAVCITDLPLFRDDRMTLAEASENLGVAIISQPALGISPLKRRLREAILHLVNEMHHGSDGHHRERQQEHMEKSQQARERSGIRNRSSRELMGSRLSERLVPIRRVTPDDEHEKDVDVRFVSATKWLGYAKLLGGMVRANRPWTILPAFRRIVAVAFATGAYGLIFPTLWKLSAAYDLYRFFVLMIASIIAMVIWLILDHGLWEPQRYTSNDRLTRFYNLTTVLTLVAGVACYYAILFVLFLIAVVLFVPASLLESTVGQSISWLTFPALAWLATSVATVAGALGSSLESDETIRSATYGYRQQLRQRKVKSRQAED